MKNVETRRSEKIAALGLRMLSIRDHPLRQSIQSSDQHQHYNNRQRQSRPFAVRVGLILAEVGLQDKRPISIDFRVAAPWTTTTLPMDLSLSRLRKGNTQPYQYQAKFSMLLESYRHTTQIYTDGSRVGNKTGCAVVSTNVSKQFRSDDCSSIFTAELYATHRAVNQCTTSTSPQSRFLICYDSLSALQSLSSMYSDNYLVHRIRQNVSSTEMSISLA